MRFRYSTNVADDASPNCASEARERDRGALRLEPCGESKRMLESKRARTDLAEGETAELQRFETSYKARC